MAKDRGQVQTQKSQTNVREEEPCVGMKRLLEDGLDCEQNQKIAEKAENAEKEKEEVNQS